MIKSNNSKVQKFSRSEFWTNIGCLVSGHTFYLGRSILWVKEK